jgi:hypothetical protein
MSDPFEFLDIDQEIRRFFGEQSEPVGVVPPVVPVPESHTLDEWREIRIGEGQCPMPGCAGNLDDDFYCGMCGCTSLPASLHSEVERVTIPLPPHELPFDEYSPCAVTEDEAA